MSSSAATTATATATALARHLSKRLAGQQPVLSRAILAPGSAAAVHQVSYGPVSPLHLQQQRQRRCQHSLSSASSSPSTSTITTTTKKDNVKPWLRHYRPQVNGRSVAFHVNDLLKQPQQGGVLPPSSVPTTSSSNQGSKKKREYESDLVVILDMDECMIHSQFLSSPSNAQVYAHQLQRQRNNGQNGSGNKVVDHFRVSLSSGDLVHVNVRPGLMEFLDQVTSRYETHVFTAAMSVYARPVLDQLDPDGTKFSQVWYREHCRFDAGHHAYLKDLEALGEDSDAGAGGGRLDLGRTVLVDNNPLSFLTHPSNGILVSSFYNDAQDNTLPAVWTLLQELEGHDDVRPVLDARFGLRNALAANHNNNNVNDQARARRASTNTPTMATGTTTGSMAPLPIQQAASAQQHQVLAV